MSMNLRHAAALALVGWYLMLPATLAKAQQMAQARLTEIGTLETWCESKISDNRWRLQFELRKAAAALQVANQSNDESLAAAIVEQTKQPRLSKEQRLELHRQVGERFSIQTMVAKVEELYRRIMARGSVS